MALKRLREMKAGQAAKFYMNIRGSRALITVIRVVGVRTLKRKVTTKKQKRVLHHDAPDWEVGEEEVVDKRQEIAEEVEEIRYLIRADNCQDMNNYKEIWVPDAELYVAYFIVDYLRAALTIEWDDNQEVENRKIVKIVYKQPTD